MNYKKLIVSIVSDQSLPNVQIIKEMGDENTDYLFVTSTRKDSLPWIVNTCNINNYNSIEGDEYDIAGFHKKLSEIEYHRYSLIVANITGGTKTMSLAVYTYFCKVPNAQIVYVMPYNKKKDIVPQYRVMWPENKVMKFNTGLNVYDYLNSYGYKYEVEALSGIPVEQTNHFFDFFVNTDMSKYDESMSLLREKRVKGIKTSELMAKIKNLLDDSNFTPRIEGKLSKEEVKYLTGGWFEEYVYFKLKTELELDDDSILTGVKLTKGDIKSNESLFKSYLGDDIEVKMDTMNEFDVMFVKNNILYIVECKTSIINKIPFHNKKTNRLDFKDENILSKTIYQVDSLKSKLGLFATSFIFTLTNFRELLNVEDKNKRNNITNKIIQDINRASMSRITLVDLYKLLSSKSLESII